MKRWSFLFLALFFSLTVKAQSYEYGKLPFADGDTLLYRYLVPEMVDGIERYPLVLYLHTSGERGNDNERTTFGAQMFLNPVNREDYPCFVIVTFIYITRSCSARIIKIFVMGNQIHCEILIFPSY